VVIDWPGERCPTHDHPPELLPGAQVAFDEDEQACFCFRCARKWLDRDVEVPARSRGLRPATWRPSPTEPF
jgi:hypothetical protein